MNKLFTRIATLGVGLAMAIGVGVAVGSDHKEVKNVHAAAATIAANSGTTANYTVNSSAGIKAGSKNNTGTIKITVPSGATSLDFYAGAWKAKTCTISLSCDGVTFGTSSFSLNADDSFSGTATSVTTTSAESNYLCSTTLSGVTASKDIILTKTGGNYNVFIVWKATYSAGSSCTHNWVAQEVHSPTCTEQGYTEYKCSLCNEEKNDSYVAALGHDYGEWQVTTPATCTSTGEKTRVCSRDASHTETETIPLAAHNYVDGVCTVCGAEEPAYFVVLPSDGTAAENADFTITKLPITVSVGASTLTSDQIRVFKNKTITISGVLIKKIVFNCTASDTSKYGPGCFAALEGYTYSGQVGTWEGSSNSVSLTAESNQVRITEIDIYIAAEGFASLITDKISCVAAGTSEPTYASGYSWSTLNSIYSTLDATEKGKLHDADADEGGTAIEKAMAKYDYIEGKYNPTDSSSSAYKNFIGRTVTPIAGSRMIFGSAIEQSSNATIIIIVISAVSLIAVGGYFLFKKKKEQ